MLEVVIYLVVLFILAGLFKSYFDALQARVLVLEAREKELDLAVVALSAVMEDNTKLRDRVNTHILKLSDMLEQNERENRSLVAENRALQKIVDAAREMREAKLGRGFKQACEMFDLSIRELDGSNSGNRKG